MENINDNDNDKVYTNFKGLYTIKKTVEELFDLSFFTEIIDPSAGSGQFKSILPITKQYDILPENDDIVKQNFFELDLEYHSKRMIATSPPFGNDRAKKFLNHCSKSCSVLIAITSNKIDHENFISGFTLISNKQFEPFSFIKNKKCLDLKHCLSVWVKK